MPTPAEWLFIAFVVAVIFGFHRIRAMGDALGAMLGGGSKAPPSDSGGDETSPGSDRPDAS